MTLLRESYLCHLWRMLLAAYRASALCRLLTFLGAWCTRQIDESRFLRPLCREGAVSRAWPESLLCRLLTFLVNLPGWLLRKWYIRLQRTFADSFFARLAFRLGDETAAAQFWVILLLWIIPFSHWNNAYSLMGFLLLLALFYIGSMHREDQQLDVTGFGCYTVLFYCGVLLAAVWSFAPSLSARFLIYHASAALCVLLTVSVVRNTADLKRLAAAGAGCVLVSSAYGIFQRIQGIEVNESYVDLELNAGMPGRIYSFFDNPNTFAQVLILLLPLVLALIVSSRHWWSRLAACCVFAAGLTALGMTYSRASWIGFACAVVVMVFLWKPKLIPAFAVLCCVAIPFLPSTIWNRLLTIGNLSDSSTSSRIPLYEAALAVIQKDPISGAGLGTAAVQAYIKEYNLYHGKAPFVHAHNFYMQVWIETGLLGIIGFVGTMLWNIKRAAHTVRHCGDSPAHTITCAAASAMCGAMVCGLADYFWNYPRVMCIFWFVFAMAAAGARVCSAQAEP